MKQLYTVLAYLSDILLSCSLLWYFKTFVHCLICLYIPCHMEVHAAVKSQALLVFFALVELYYGEGYSLYWYYMYCTLFDLSCYTDLHKKNSVVLMLCGNTCIIFLLVSAVCFVYIPVT